MITVGLLVITGLLFHGLQNFHCAGNLAKPNDKLLFEDVWSHIC